MPRLSDLTDYNYDPMGSAVPAELPVDKPFKDLKKVYITGEEELPVKFSDAPVKGDSGSFSNNVDKILNSLFRDDDKRLQLWPEKLLRSGTTAAGKAASGELPQWAVDPATGDVHTSPQMVEAAQEMSALAGTGGLGGTGGTLNATPSLRPALKHNGKIYKGKPGQEHMDVIPESMYPDFQKKAMSGEDIKEYNFGFINDKGHFLSREDALKYGIDNGLIDPQAGKFGALTSTLMADSSKPGAAIEAMKTANPFFSALEHNVKQISQSKMTGDQWLGTLGNKPGVKPEELQWTGLQDFLNENKGKPVTKAQIEEHLQNNKVELKEIQKGTGELKAAADDLQKSVGNKIKIKGEDFYPDEVEMGLYNGALKPSDLPTHLQDKAQKLLDYRYQQEQPTKYSSYQLPGGENYREMLMTLPNKQQRLYEWEYFDPKTQTSKQFKTEAEAKAAAPEGAIVGPKETQTLNEAYRSSHWDEPNILAHVRMNDRTIEGKKSLHLEEIQSDWHQQGREKGYRPEQEKKLADLVKQREDLQKEASVLSTRDERYKEIHAELPKLQTKINDIGSGGVGVPDAPFKKSWHELALKRMLREASEKGYDRLSWTPGEAQAARYDLSKTLNKVSYNPQQKYLKAWDKNGNEVMTKEGVTPEQLPDFVGKEGAKSLLEQKPKDFSKIPNVERKDLKIEEGEHNYVVTTSNGRVVKPGKGTVRSKEEALEYAERYFNTTAKEINTKRELEYGRIGHTHILEGQELKVGGEGMKGFYDQIIPKALEKLGKEHGVKVKYNEHMIKGNASKDYDKFIETMRSDLHKEFYNDAIKEGFAPDKAKRFADKHTAGETWNLAKAAGKEKELDKMFKAKLEYEKNGNQPVHYIDIPQSLKDTATQKGFPLFSAGGYMLMPVVGNPFEDKK